jgi:hypothetical protein
VQEQVHFGTLEQGVSTPNHQRRKWNFQSTIGYFKPNKTAFTQKNRITVQPALNVQSIQVQEDAPEIQLELGELKLILKDPLIHFGRKELTNDTFKDEIISLSKIENHQEVVYLENPNNSQIPKFKGIARVDGGALTSHSSLHQL